MSIVISEFADSEYYDEVLVGKDGLIMHYQHINGRRVCVGRHNPMHVELAGRRISKKMYENRRVSMTDFLYTIRRVTRALRELVEHYESKGK